MALVKEAVDKGLNVALLPKSEEDAVAAASQEFSHSSSSKRSIERLKVTSQPIFQSSSGTTGHKFQSAREALIRALEHDSKISVPASSGPGPNSILSSPVSSTSHLSSTSIPSSHAPPPAHVHLSPSRKRKLPVSADNVSPTASLGINLVNYDDAEQED